MSPTGTKVTIKQQGWHGAFQMWVNGELLGEVVSVEYRTGVHEAPVVTVGFFAPDVEIELSGATVEILRGEYGEGAGPGGCVGDKNDISMPQERDEPEGGWPSEVSTLTGDREKLDRASGGCARCGQDFLR